MNRRSFLRAAAGFAAAFGLGPLAKAAKADPLAKYKAHVNAGPWPVRGLALPLTRSGPGYYDVDRWTRECPGARMYLDGRDVTNTATACNVDEGWVARFRHYHDSEGRLCFSQPPERYISRGKVEIRRRPFVRAGDPFPAEAPLACVGHTVNPGGSVTIRYARLL